MKRGRRREPRQDRSRALVAAVVEAATQLLQDDENDKLSMKAIARRAGVGIGSVYEYFTDRDGIIDAIVDRLADINFQRLKAVLDAHNDVPLGDAFGALIDETIEVYLESPRLSRFVLKTAVRFDRMDFVIKERDAFHVLIADRLCEAFPRLERAEAMSSALAATEMLSGIVLGELYRDENAARRAGMRNAMSRFMDAELLYLASRQAPDATAPAAPPSPDAAPDA